MSTADTFTLPHATGPMVPQGCQRSTGNAAAAGPPGPLWRRLLCGVAAPAALVLGGGIAWLGAEDGARGDWSLSLRAYSHDLPTTVERTQFRVRSSFTSARVARETESSDYDRAMRTGAELAFQRRLGPRASWISGFGIALTDQSISLLGLNYSEEQQVQQLQAIQNNNTLAFVNAALAAEDEHNLRTSAVGLQLHSGFALRLQPLRFEFSGVLGAGASRTRTEFRATRVLPPSAFTGGAPLILPVEHQARGQSGAYWEGGARGGAFVSIGPLDVGVIGGWLYRQDWMIIDNNVVATDISDLLLGTVSESALLRLTSQGLYLGGMVGFTF